MHALLAMVPEMQRTIAVDFYAAKTIDEVLSQQRHNFPGFVRQMDVMEQCGSQHGGAPSAEGGEMITVSNRSKPRGNCTTLDHGENGEAATWVHKTLLTLKERTVQLESERGGDSTDQDSVWGQV